MRTALFVAAALAAGGLVVPVSAVAAPAPVAGATYNDPAQAGAATLSITGILTPVHAENGPERYSLSLPGGTLVPVSLDGTHTDEIVRPQHFSGDVVIPTAVADRAESRGASIEDGDDIAATSSDGKRVIAAASTSAVPLPVQSATLRPQTASDSRATARPATASTAQRLYVAVIASSASDVSASAVSSATAAMRSYWTTNSDGLISSFTQPTATVRYTSTTASTANHCGLSSNTDAVWNEAAAKFSGIDFSADGNHLMVVAPAACASGAVGIGTVGGSLRSGGRTIVTLGDTGVAVGVHELGHNFSLQHANAEQCSASCSTQEYWDLYSIMGLAVGGGNWTPDSLDTAYRMQTGIADAAEVPTISTAQTVSLSPRGATSGTRGLIVTDPATKARYAVEYRSGTGRDAGAFYRTAGTFNHYTFRPGVVVTRIEKNQSTTVMTRKSGSDYLTSFVEGETFARGRVSVAVTSVTDGNADVAVTFPESTSTPTTPSTPTAGPASFTTATPVIVGTAQVGRRLTVRPGTWSPRPEHLSAQWFAGGTALGRASSIVVPSSAYGQPITVRVTGSRRGYETASRTSAPTAAVQAGRFSSKRIRITGHATVGRKLVAHTGTWSPHPSFSYRWYANGHRIAKAKSRTLKVTRALRGKRIVVRITARQSGYRATSMSSPRTRHVR